MEAFCVELTENHKLIYYNKLHCVSRLYTLTVQADFYMLIWDLGCFSEN